MIRVLAITTIVDRLCDSTLRTEEARPALLSAGNSPSVSKCHLQPIGVAEKYTGHLLPLINRRDSTRPRRKPIGSEEKFQAF